MEIALADTDRTLQQLLSLNFIAPGTRETGTDEDRRKFRAPLSTGEAPSELPRYESPRLTVMKEDEVLSAFQVPVVATTWWG